MVIVCGDSFPAPRCPKFRQLPEMRFGEACGIYRSDGVVQNRFPIRAGAASRWSAPRLWWAAPRMDDEVLLPTPFVYRSVPKCEGALVKRIFRPCGNYRSDVSSHLFTPGPLSRFRSGRCQGIGQAGKHMPCPSSAMSSGRLFLDRVARQHCPSPLHRHLQTNMHSSQAQAKGDISTLQRRGHFYFALTGSVHSLPAILPYGTMLVCGDLPPTPRVCPRLPRAGKNRNRPAPRIGSGRDSKKRCKPTWPAIPKNSRSGTGLPAPVPID